ncbi:hypothetical protein [Halpernia humi]|nr:hypothetical protein [Halpernia humi]
MKTSCECNDGFTTVGEAVSRWEKSSRRAIFPNEKRLCDVRALETR